MTDPARDAWIAQRYAWGRNLPHDQGLAEFEEWKRDHDRDLAAPLVGRIVLAETGQSWSRAKERMPLTGVRLLRWKAACALYRLGCRVGGRHEFLVVWDVLWKEWYCPHCGWIDENKPPPEIPK